ncbi:hypothetical protein BBF96_01755 [Anoxybacter fermentans]|uniref:Uncharacterized protein n=1 Tax=Anoxybacter fermentans TaxID=1323375 RepID=A0A3Q9HP20_9FIRM|nr:SoxR reducing system RseC family protein [Anoxybacter fermentans]AZR72232.1 hypothetical protein BBF96_01755 [Anoxybacter fermentans]
MEEYAQVTRILEGGTAEVEIRRHSACGKCGKCGHINNARFEVSNPINAKVGDIVVLEMETRHLITAVLIIYLLPLVNLIIGYALGNWFNTTLNIWKGEGFAIFCGLIFMALTFGFVRIYDRRMGVKSGFKPRIKRVINDSR